MTVRCFVDANVIVYSRDSRDPVKQRRADAWLDHLWREQRGCTSVQAISEAYATLKRLSGGGSEELWNRVARFFAWDPQPVDEAVLRRAHEIEQRYRLSWWDSMIVAAAQLKECTLLLTEDLQDGAAFGPVIVRSPFTLAIEEPAGAYAAAPVPASHHRPRGRPRRAASIARP